MNTSTEHMLVCNRSVPLADDSERIVDLMIVNEFTYDSVTGSTAVVKVWTYNDVEH